MSRIRQMRGHGQHLTSARGSHVPVHPTTGEAINPHTMKPHEPVGLDSAPMMGPFEQAMMPTKLPKGVALPRAPRPPRGGGKW